MDMGDLFWEVHSNLPRESPGSDVCTLKALREVYDGQKEIRVLDVGCGCGPQTVCLAQRIHGTVVALDIYQPFLDFLAQKVKNMGLEEIVQLELGDMLNMNFEPESFDLIWSEGSIYRMGFANGIKNWRQFIKPQGHLVVSDLSWLCHIPSAEAEAFWDNLYPEMKSIDEKIDIIDQCGYHLIDWFALPHSAWWDNYYTPMRLRIDFLLKKYHDNPAKVRFLQKELKEIQIYQRYGQEYGYAFFIMQKRDEE